jgi:hypothetical protein
MTKIGDRSAHKMRLQAAIFFFFVKSFKVKVSESIDNIF